MTIENAQKIINELNLNCSAEEFVDYYNLLDIDTTELENIQPVISTFDKLYPGPNGDVIIENPANGKYYYYFTIGGRTFLQNHVPYIQGLQPLTDDNINQVIEDHKNKLIQDYINQEKLRLTIEHFSSQ